MNIHPDFEELLRLLEEHHVEYMIVGGYAVAYHGYPRFTKDIDIFFNISRENASRIQQAFIAFGFKDNEVPVQAFTTLGNVLTFGVIPSRVDLINQIDAVSYEDARKRAVRVIVARRSSHFSVCPEPLGDRADGDSDYATPRG